MQFPIPQHLEKRSDDYVSYTAVAKNGKATAVDGICYASHMSKLSENSFDLVPYRKEKEWKKSAIDGESYIRFMELLADHGMMPSGSKAGVDCDGVPTLFIPFGASRHRVYSAMCAYRWAESLSPFVFLTLKLTDERKDLSLWQILHYVMSVLVASAGHNWCNVAMTHASHGQLYSCNGMSYNLALSLSFPLLWYKSEKELLEHNESMTCLMIDNIAAKIGPCGTATEKRYSIKLPTLLVSGSPDGRPMENDCLNAMWNPLYQVATTAATGNCDYDKLQKELHGMYEEITKGYEPIRLLKNKIDGKN